MSETILVGEKFIFKGKSYIYLDSVEYGTKGINESNRIDFIKSIVTKSSCGSKTLIKAMEL